MLIWILSACSSSPEKTAYAEMQAALDWSRNINGPRAGSILEKQAIRNALRVHGGNREQAAKSLGIGERTLYRKLKEYGIK